jgi:hypothetical protein
MYFITFAVGVMMMYLPVTPTVIPFHSSHGVYIRVEAFMAQISASK